MRTIILLLASSLLLSVEAHDIEYSISASELQSVFQLYPTIYRESPEYFWMVLNQSRNRALRCTSVKEIEGFLQIVNLPSQGADLEEFISESVEKLCVKQQKCFNQAMSLLDGTTRRNVKRKLKTPLYFDVDELSGCK